MIAGTHMRQGDATLRGIAAQRAGMVELITGIERRQRPVGATDRATVGISQARALGRLGLKRSRLPRIVLVHDVPEFADTTAAPLRDAGYDVTVFMHTMSALHAFDAENGIDVLITRVGFSQGQPHGVALAQMARVRRPGIKVLFVGVPERREHTEGLGELLTAPVTATDVVETVGKMLAAGQ
jgi:CheY-like chemotaxis protein